jgi:hypothetical protein
MTPTKEEIERCARKIYATDCYRNGVPELADVSPEIGELRENGCWSQAISELMTNTETKNEKWVNTVSETSAFTVDIQQLFESNALILGSRHTGKSDIAMLISDKANAIVIVFDPSLDWIARSSIRNYVKVCPYTILDVPSESIIYDVSLCAPLDQQKIVENFARKLFEHQAQTSNRKQYLVIFEESHTYFFQNAMRSKNAVHSVRMLSVGRNVGISCLLISQFACMIDKFCVRHALSQAWFGFSREPNDIKYLKQILGSEVEKLSKLSDGEFIYLTRNGISKINIESYENQTAKQQIVIPQITHIEPIKTTQNTSIIPIAKLFILLGFAVLTLNSLRGM